MARENYIENLKKICDEANSHNNGYHYEMKVSDWQSGNKSRTYFSIVETRDNSKHYGKKDYGYFDNASENYTRGAAHLDGELFTFSGSKF